MVVHQKGCFVIQLQGKSFAEVATRSSELWIEVVFALDVSEVSCVGRVQVDWQSLLKPSYEVAQSWIIVGCSGVDVCDLRAGAMLINKSRACRRMSIPMALGHIRISVNLSLNHTLTSLRISPSEIFICFDSVSQLLKVLEL